MYDLLTTSLLKSQIKRGLFAIRDTKTLSSMTLSPNVVAKFIFALLHLVSPLMLNASSIYINKWPNLAFKSRTRLGIDVAQFDFVSVGC